MNNLSFYIIFGFLAVEAFGFSVRNKRQTQDSNENKLEDRFGPGNWPTQFQPQNPGNPWYPQNPFFRPPPGQPWNQYPYPGPPPPGQPWPLPNPGHGHLWYPYPPPNPGQAWNPGQVWNPVPPLNPGQTWNPGQTPIPGQTWNPSQTWNPGQQLIPGPVTTVVPNQDQTSTTSTTESEANGEKLAAADCIRSCPVTAEYNPVCGSNNVTYDNPGRLECAKMCGTDVQMVRRSPCPK